jgi:hypothetical protein
MIGQTPKSYQRHLRLLRTAFTARVGAVTIRLVTLTTDAPAFLTGPTLHEPPTQSALASVAEKTAIATAQITLFIKFSLIIEIKPITT